MGKHCFPTPCSGIVRELGLVAKIRFADKRNEGKVLVGDMVDVWSCGIRLSERCVWFEFAGVVEVPAHRVWGRLFFRYFCYTKKFLPSFSFFYTYIFSSLLVG